MRDKLWYIHVMECYSSISNNASKEFSTIWKTFDKLYWSDLLDKEQENMLN